MNVCIITDNFYIYEHFVKLLEKKQYTDHRFDFFYSPWNRAFAEKFGDGDGMRPIRLRDQGETFFDAYDLFLSLHCKQLFPDAMVNGHLCINVHPGYNPHNRGWFPQVFSIINGLPIGVTIHKMDTELDHGPILWQEALQIGTHETSKDVYDRILALEMQMMDVHLDDLLSGNFTLTPMAEEGNVNYKQDFDDLCRIDPDRPATWGEVIDYLRAMTHAPYQNAYFIDEDGKRVYVGITLKKED